jgi:hypothetical protein
MDAIAQKLCEYLASYGHAEDCECDRIAQHPARNDHFMVHIAGQPTLARITEQIARSGIKSPELYNNIARFDPDGACFLAITW